MLFLFFHNHKDEETTTTVLIEETVQPTTSSAREQEGSTPNDVPRVTNNYPQEFTPNPAGGDTSGNDVATRQVIPSSTTTETPIPGSLWFVWFVMVRLCGFVRSYPGNSTASDIHTDCVFCYSTSTSFARLIHM